MSGEEISAVLTEESIAYEDAKQYFFASGRTRYTTAEDSWGYWRVEDDRYCSQWPPGQEWDCYTVEASGNLLRWVDEWGNASIGSLIP